MEIEEERKGENAESAEGTDWVRSDAKVSRRFSPGRMAFGVEMGGGGEGGVEGEMLAMRFEEGVAGAALAMGCELGMSFTRSSSREVSARVMRGMSAGRGITRWKGTGEGAGEGEGVGSGSSSGGGTKRKASERGRT